MSSPTSTLFTLSCSSSDSRSLIPSHTLYTPDLPRLPKLTQFTLFRSGVQLSARTNSSSIPVIRNLIVAERKGGGRGRYKLIVALMQVTQSSILDCRSSRCDRTAVSGPTVIQSFVQSASATNHLLSHLQQAAASHHQRLFRSRIDQTSCIVSFLSPIVAHSPIPATSSGNR